MDTLHLSPPEQAHEDLGARRCGLTARSIAVRRGPSRRPGKGGGAGQARRGFMFIDVIAGLLIVCILGAAFTVSLIQFSKSRVRLAEQRQAARDLEAALVLAQTSRAPVPQHITVEQLSAVDGKRWSRLAVKFGKTGELSVIAPTTTPIEGGAR